MFEEIWQIVVDWINDFYRKELIPEAIGFLVIILLGLILSFVLRLVLKGIKKAFGQGPTLTLAPWLHQVLDLGLQVVRPFSIWITGKAIIQIMGNSNQPHGVLDYIMTFIGLWLIYRILSSLISMLMEPEKIPLWNDQILRPTIIVLALMHIVGILDSILDFELNLGKGVVIRLAAEDMGYVRGEAV